MDLTQYLDLFRRRAALILLMVFLAVDVAALATWLGPRTYEARALLQVRATSASGTAYQDADYAAERIPNYPPLVRSPEVVESAAAVAGVRPEQLSGALSAVNPPGTAQLQVTARAGDSRSAALFADAAAQSLAEVIADQEPGPVRVRAEVVVPAVEPVRPSSPNLVLNLAGGAVAGLSLGLLAAVMGRSGARVLRGAADVHRVSGLELLSQVPPVGGRHRVGPAAEAGFRELTASLLQATGGQLPRTLLLTAACPDAESAPADLVEGWAGYLASGGWRVGILEAHAAAGEEPEQPGWSDLMAGRAQPDRIRVPARGGTITVIPVGGSAHLLTPADLAARSRWMLGEVAASLDVLLVRTKPSEEPLNTTLLAPAVSGAVVLACYSETTEEQLDVAVLELRTLGAEVFGAVMLDVPSRRRSRVLHLSRGMESPAADSGGAVIPARMPSAPSRAPGGTAAVSSPGAVAAWSGRPAAPAGAARPPAMEVGG